MKCFLRLLFGGLLVMSQPALAQLYNNDTLYVAPGTDFFVDDNNISDITNDDDGYWLNKGQTYFQPYITNYGKLINQDTLVFHSDYFGTDGSLATTPGSVVKVTGSALSRSFYASSSETDTISILSMEADLLNDRTTVYGIWYIRDSIHFGNGIIATPVIESLTDAFRLTPTSTKTYGHSNSFVDGPLEVSLNRELFFPIGSNPQYAPVSVTGLAAATGYYRMHTSANYIPPNPITGTPDSGMFSLSSSPSDRYWKSSFIGVSGITLNNPKMMFTFDLNDESVAIDTFINVAHATSYDGQFKTLGITNISLSDPNYRTITTDTITTSSKFEGYYCLGERNFIKANLKVLLEGPYNSGSGEMDALLNPYDFGGGNYQYHLDSLYGAASTISGYPKMLTGYSVPSNAVDVVRVFLRAGMAYNTTIDSAYAWLLNDGDILDFETGTSPYIRFASKGAGNYYIVVEHRNHLPIMSAVAELTDYSASPTQIDLTDPSNVYLGSWGTNYVSGTQVAMISGNAYEEGSHEVNASDYFMVSSINEGVPESVYYPEDINLDGIVNASDVIMVDINSQYLYYSVVPY